jgi:hypothetical protein
VEGGEYLLLKLWSEAVAVGLAADAEFVARFEGLKVRLWLAMGRYSGATWAQLRDPYAMMSYAGHEVLYNHQVLAEAGRLGLILLLPPNLAEFQVVREDIRLRLVELLNVHPGARLPALDGDAIDLSLALAGLMSAGDFTNVNALVTDIATRMELAARAQRLMPVATDLVEDAIALREQDVEPAAVCRINTLVPMLAAIAALTRNEAALQILRERLPEHMAGITLERWYPKAEIDQIATQRPDGFPGVSRALRALEANCSAEAAAALDLPAGAVASGEIACVANHQAAVLAVSARVFRHPLPTWYLERFRPLAAPAAAAAPSEPEPPNESLRE